VPAPIAPAIATAGAGSGLGRSTPNVRPQNAAQVRPAASDSVTASVLEIVAAKTGYPQDMLDLDLDLEADLGIDTVKQAETLAAIRETFGIPVQQNLSLRDYPTLKHVIGFVYTMRPDLQARRAGQWRVRRAAPAAAAAGQGRSARSPGGEQPGR
jgi:acyl carrier protein